MTKDKSPMHKLRPFVCLLLSIGCVNDPQEPQPALRYDVQFWNASGIDVTDVVIFDGLKEMSCGVLFDGISKCMIAQETRLSGKEMRLEYVEELSSGELRPRKITIPPLKEDYNGKAIIIKILPDINADVTVADETIFN